MYICRHTYMRAQMCTVYFIYAFATWQRHQRRYVFRLSVLSARCICSSVRPDRSCYHNISWMVWAMPIKLTGNIHWPLPMTWLDYWSQVRFTAGYRGGEGVHFDSH